MQNNGNLTNSCKICNYAQKYQHYQHYQGPKIAPKKNLKIFEKGDSKAYFCM